MKISTKKEDGENEMTCKRKVTIFIFVTLLLFSSVSCQDSWSRREANNDRSIGNFEDCGSISSGTKSESSIGTSINDHLTASVPQIVWQKCLGGSRLDEANSVQQTADGGCIVAGDTNSTDGDVSGNRGARDAWLVKLDSVSTIQWQKCLGGSRYDEANSVQQTTDGYIVAGDTNSNDDDVSGNHGNYDAWVVKLDSVSTIQWQKCLGGSRYDYAINIQQTTDGGYIVAGLTNSTNGDVSGNHGNYDAWVVKLDSVGNIQWQKCLGGSHNEEANSVQQTADRGYIVVGDTNSTDGDVSGNHGNYDAWVVKLDSAGNIKWQKCLGGSRYDEANSVQQTADGGYIVAGDTNSIDGNVKGNHGNYDSWVVKLDKVGNIRWQKCLGGSRNEEAISIQQITDKGYIVAGDTNSTDGDVSGNHGDYDSWVVKLDSIGHIQWQKCMGGSAYDDSWSARQTTDGRYIAAGLTFSNDGDVSGNHGNGDAWAVKLDAPPSTPNTPSGPRSGFIRRPYRYSTSAIDPDGEQIKYTFDWGDGTTSVTGLIDSGKRAIASHLWFKPGNYRVRVMATDSVGSSSGWSRTLTVTEEIPIALVAG